ncbi:aminotransferase class V-fold PLP-dependent enzyme [Nitrococcus mobilis]|uniref:Aminotransferase, class V n=1 Tax=Nitrococcus mobilis Nb-231 TaxID=314278 RepID=A4BMM8_9GAMM|nr:aminotransferase class V-fold PLP-dependent enzyme [Nitrococcus mobilis]EAR23566.1 Aminotransferase, class V [Nitrococcus mobilis Nb-231]
MRDEFPHENGLIYLNHAGVAPWPRRAYDAVAAFAQENISRGAADYARWNEVEQQLRERLARLIVAPTTDDIALVKNTSEGLSLVAYGLDWQAGDNVVINTHEFPSNRMVWESLGKRFGVEVRDVALDGAATPEDAILAAMDARTRVLPVSTVQYGSGLRMDLERLGQACRDNGTLFCIDAIQSLGALRLDAPKINADFVTADGHKWMLGPEGLGLFYSTPQARDRLNLLQYGWHMAAHMGDYSNPDWSTTSSARRFEAGSPNMLGIHGLEASLAVLEEIGATQVEQAVLNNARHLIRRIQTEPRLTLISPAEAHRHAGIVTFRANGVEALPLYQRLRRSGVVCACRLDGIRFSAHYYNTVTDLDRAIDLVLAIQRDLKAGS